MNNSMIFSLRILSMLNHLMYKCSGALLLVMVFVVVADVFTRFIFDISDGALNLTFDGSVEITIYSLLFLIIFALPRTLQNSQVVVDVFTNTLNAQKKDLLNKFYIFGIGAFGGAISYGFFNATLRVMKTNETTQDLLIPMVYIYALASFGTALLFLSALAYIFAPKLDQDMFK